MGKSHHLHRAFEKAIIPNSFLQFSLKDVTRISLENDLLIHSQFSSDLCLEPVVITQCIVRWTGDTQKLIRAFTEKELAEMKKVFDEVDKDGSGAIDKKEMKKMLKKLNAYPGDKEFEVLFKEIDADGSGTVEFDEMVEAVRKMFSAPSEDKLRKKFSQLDKDGDGVISFDEIKNGFLEMGMIMSDKQIHDMISVADEDGDGQITFEEFKAIANRKR